MQSSSQIITTNKPTPSILQAICLPVTQPTVTALKGKGQNQPQMEFPTLIYLLTVQPLQGSSDRHISIFIITVKNICFYGKNLPSVLSDCWLDDRKGIWPAKKSCVSSTQRLFGRPLGGTGLIWNDIQKKDGSKESESRSTNHTSTTLLNCST